MLLLMLNQDNILTLTLSRLLLRCSDSALSGDHSFSDADQPASAASVVPLLWTTQRELDSIYIYIWTLQKFCILFSLVVFSFWLWLIENPYPPALLPMWLMKHCDTAVVTISVFLQQILAFIFCLYTTAFFIPPHNPRPTKPKVL